MSSEGAFDPAERTRSVVRRLLDGMSEGREVRAYLKRFGEIERGRFAVVKVGGGVLAEHRDAVGAALAFLHNVGLYPVVVHGAGPQLDMALAAKGIAKTTVDGLRVTPPSSMGLVADVVRGETATLGKYVRIHGGRAAVIARPVVRARLLDEARYGRVGAPEGVTLGPVEDALDAGEIPVMSCLGETADGGLVNVNADAVVRALVEALRPEKIIFLTPTGGLLGPTGEVVSVIHLTSDLDGLLKADWLGGGMRVKLREIAELLERLPLTASAAITSPDMLVKELFTHSGSGTLIRRGETLAVVRDKGAIDEARLLVLIEKAFGRRPRTEWWRELAFDRAVLSQSMRAAAVMTPLDGVEGLYLDKFAVLEEARGEGLGKAVWNRLIQEAPRLYWRSREENGFNRFYDAQCDGSVRRGRWRVYWRGEGDWSAIARAVDAVAAKPPSFAGQG